MTLSPQHFLYAFDAATGVATVTLNRPDVLNALTFESYQELRDTFFALTNMREVRAVVLTGSGRAFCSGGDVEKIIGELFSRDYEGLLAFTRLTGQLIGAIRHCSKPVIAALNGTTSGAGAVMAAACDVRIAAESAKIAFLFTQVGLSGADMGAAWLLPRLIGMGRATELLMTGAFVSAADALTMGLYNRVVPTDQLMDEARAFAERLARGPTFALGITKELLTRQLSVDLDSALELDAQAQAVCMQHAHFREGYEAFKAKRKPEFR